MSTIREVLRLTQAGRSKPEISQICGVAESTVSEYRRLARQAGLSWAQIEPMSEAEVAAVLAKKAARGKAVEKPLPDLAAIHAELAAHKHLTLQLCWQEYRFTYPVGYSYSQFAKLYRDYKRSMRLTMRKTYRPGEVGFADYAGATVPIIDPRTGEVMIEAQIFVACLGYSNYTFAEATATQSLADWTGSHVRAWRYFGGVPESWVIDNLKSGVTEPHRYEPLLNRTFWECAEHYGVPVIPARVRKPQDKAKVEKSVQLVERWILMALRKEAFSSLNSLNERIRELLERLNAKRFQKLPGSRREVFEQRERLALLVLPATDYEHCEWNKATVNFDYHVEVAGNFYSAPHRLKGKRVDVRLTAMTVELFLDNERVASHLRSHRKDHYSTHALDMPSTTTDFAHMPRAHQRYSEWSAEKALALAQSYGPVTHEFIQRLLATRRHPEQGFRSARWILTDLGKKWGAARLESACALALKLKVYNGRTVNSILQSGRDLVQQSKQEQLELPQDHPNVRGGDYYH